MALKIHEVGMDDVALWVRMIERGNGGLVFLATGRYLLGNLIGFASWDHRIAMEAFLVL